MSDETKNLIELLLYAVPFALGIVFAVWGKPWIDAKVGTEKANQFFGWVGKFVKAAEQVTAGSSMGTQKYSYVFDAVRGFADGQAINVTDKQIKAAIEAAVLELKLQTAPALAPVAVGKLEVTAPAVEETSKPDGNG